MLLKVNKEMLADAMQSIGVHQASLPIFAHKNQILPFITFTNILNFYSIFYYANQMKYL